MLEKHEGFHRTGRNSAQEQTEGSCTGPCDRKTLQVLPWDCCDESFKNLFLLPSSHSRLNSPWRVCLTVQAALDSPGGEEKDPEWASAWSNLRRGNSLTGVPILFKDLVIVRWWYTWRRKWQPTPVFLPGESHGQRSMAGCSLWGRTESDTTEHRSLKMPHVCLCAQSCLTLCDPSVHGTFQARTLEGGAISYFRGSSQPRARTRVSCISCIAGGFFTSEPPEKPDATYAKCLINICWIQ